jgi:hypothetical protein
MTRRAADAGKIKARASLSRAHVLMSAFVAHVTANNHSRIEALNSIAPMQLPVSTVKTAKLMVSLPCCADPIPIANGALPLARASLRS